MEADDRKGLAFSSDSGGSYGAVEAKVRHIGAIEGNSTLLTAGIIIADVVGAGILSMAPAVAKFGWALGALLIMLLLMMNVHISILMWRVRMSFPGVQTYAQLVDAAFSRSSPTLRHVAVNTTAIVQYLFIFSMLGIYALSIGKGLGNLFYHVHICLPQWTALGCLLLGPIHVTARRLGSWRSLIYVNVATILGTTIIPLVSMATVGVDSTRADGSNFYAFAPLDFAGVLGGLSTFTFAFTSQFMVTEIIAEMSNPADFPKAYIWLAAPFQVFCFSLVGLVGYYYMGDKVSGMIGDNLPFGIAFQSAAACLVMHMLITYMLKGIVICSAIHHAWSKESASDESMAGWSVWAVIVTLIMAAAWTVAQIVPFFMDLVDLIGASFTPVACYIIPIVVYVKWLRDFATPEQQISKFEWCCIAIEITLAAVLLFLGTFYAILAIMDKWVLYGPPFACHCEQMWNTCECSALHAGMADMCPAGLAAFQASNSSDTEIFASKIYPFASRPGWLFE